MNENNKPTIVCYGEVLWDIFPDGARAGGAPFNVAYNLHKMGAEAYMISAIGEDKLGNDLVQVIQGWGIDISTIQQYEQYPTGTVIANMDDHNDAHYEIIAPVAWDHIQYREADKRLLERSDALVFGSLVTRNETSRNTLHQLIELARIKVFDINLRPPFIDVEEIKYLLGKANIVKMNKAELRQVLEWAHIPYESEEISMKKLSKEFTLDEIIVTKGSKGAAYLHGDDFFRVPAFHVEIKDTVGSGDSFLAGFLSSHLGKGPLSDLEALQYAAGLGAFITNHEGACPEYTKEEFLDFYHKQLVGTK